MRDAIRKNLLVGLAAFICLMTCIIMLATQQSNASRLQAQQNKIGQLSGQIDVRRAANQQQGNQTQQQATGMDAQRKSDDDTKILPILKLATTWSSYAEYQKNRQILMGQYKLDPKGTFMQKYMPEVTDSVDSTGQHFNQIDTGKLNMSYQSMISTVTSIKTNGYHYFTLVTASSQSADQKASAPTITAVTYRIDSNGQVNDLEAVPNSGETHTTS